MIRLASSASAKLSGPVAKGRVHEPQRCVLGQDGQRSGPCVTTARHASSSSRECAATAPRSACGRPCEILCDPRTAQFQDKSPALVHPHSIPGPSTVRSSCQDRPYSPDPKTFFQLSTFPQGLLLLLSFLKEYRSIQGGALRPPGRCRRLVQPSPRGHRDREISWSSGYSKANS